MAVFSRSGSRNDIVDAAPPDIVIGALAHFTEK
jgi:hypothetical protein